MSRLQLRAHCRRCPTYTASTWKAAHTPDGVRGLAASPSLQSLVLGCPADFSALTTLTHLDLRGACVPTESGCEGGGPAEFTDSAARAIAHLTRLRCLLLPSIGESPIGMSAAFAEGLAPLLCLTRLALSNPEEGDGVLYAAAKLQSLADLALPNCGIDCSNEVKALSALSALTRLDLSGNIIADLGVRAFGEGFPALRCLELRDVSWGITPKVRGLSVTGPLHGSFGECGSQFAIPPIAVWFLWQLDKREPQRNMLQAACIVLPCAERCCGVCMLIRSKLISPDICL